MADRHIMIQRINDQCDIFAHIACDVIRFGEKLRCLVYDVGGQNFCEESFLIALSNFSSPLVNSPKVEHM